MAQTQHSFLFKPGTWIGEGKISFSLSADCIHFYTRWNSSPSEEPLAILWTQEVELKGEMEKMVNHFTLTPLKEDSFSVELENNVIGTAIGRGVIEPDKIAWEIKIPEIFHGLEVYTLQDNGDYHVRAEYAAEDNFRTVIEGRIWLKK